MATAVRVFCEIAARYGGVDPNDLDAVRQWFREEAPKLSKQQREEILEDLIAQDGKPRERVDRPYADPVPLPSLSDSPLAVAVPPGVFRRVWRWLAGVPRNGA